MKRRTFISLLGSSAVAWPCAARAQQTGRVWRVAVIGAVSPLPAMLSAFHEALQQRGWTEGKNLSIDVRWPKVSFAQEPGLISEVLHSNVDVIVAWATPSALAARRATSTIPIVFLGISDPVGSGLAASLAHPGGNATGSSNVAPDLSAKLVGRRGGEFRQSRRGRSNGWNAASGARSGLAVASGQCRYAGRIRARIRASQDRGRQRRATAPRSFQHWQPSNRQKLPSLRSSTGCQPHFSYGRTWRRAVSCRMEPTLTTSSV